MDIQITGGSEKQNAWATKIAEEQIQRVDAEISNTVMRADTSLDWYLADLRARRATLELGFSKITAKQLIDLHVAGRANLADALIAQSRSARS